jgi:hypothetical protein
VSLEVPRPTPRFAIGVVLSKREVFDALEACAAAERGLLRAGRATEAAGVASLFEMLEYRVTRDPETTATVDPETTATVDPETTAAVDPGGPLQPPAGGSFSNSSDREFTQ